jgi:hypothetical protein
MKLLNIVLLVAIGMFLLIKPAFGKTADNSSRAARESKLKDLLSRVGWDLAHWDFSTRHGTLLLLRTFYGRIGQK